MSLRDLEKLYKSHAKAAHAAADAKRESNAASGPAVPALVPTAATTADDDEAEDIIEGEGTSKEKMTMGMAHHQVREKLKKMPSTFINEAGLLATLGLLRHKTSEIAKLRDLLRKDKQLVFKNREVMYRPTYYAITCKDELEAELQSMYLRGQGGMLIEQLKESYVTIEEDIQALIDEDKALLVDIRSRGQAKPPPGRIADRAVLFFRDTTYEVKIDPDFKEKWVDCKLDSKAAPEIKKMLMTAKLPLMKTEIIDDGKKKRRKKKRRIRAAAAPKLNLSGAT